MRHHLPWALGALALMTMLSGCDNPPKGQSGGRIGVSETTWSEQRSERVLPVALIEFSDQAAQQLAQDLARIRADGQIPDRVTILLGDIENKTQIVSSDEFEMSRSRLRSSLLQSQHVRGWVKWVEGRARMQYLRARELDTAQGFTPEPIQDFDTAYALNGSFYRISRGDMGQYGFEFQLTRFATNEIVWSSWYEIKQQKAR